MRIPLFDLSIRIFPQWEGGDEATALSSGFGKELMDGDGTIRMDF